MTLFDCLFLKCVKIYDIETLIYHSTGLKKIVSKFHRDFFITSEVIAFFTETDFCHCTYFFAYNSRTNKYFQNLIFSRERMLKDLLKSLQFLIKKKSLIRYKIYFLGLIDLFSPYFFGKLGQNGLIMDDLCS